MIYDRLVNKVIEEAGVVNAPGMRQAGQLKDEADFKAKMSAKGYTFEPIDKEESARTKEIYNHNPLYPKASQEEAEEVLNKATMRLGAAFFGLGQFLKRMNPVCNHPKVATAAVDESGNFYYSSDFIVKLAERGLGEVTGLLLHEIAHLGMDDGGKSKNICQTPGDHTRWNVASDYVNNWYIKNDIEGMNIGRTTPDANGAVKPPIPISLPEGGLMADDDGIIKRIPISADEYLVFPPSDQIDLNNRPTEEVYAILKRLDDEIIDFMDQTRFDAHIPQATIEADEVITVAGEDGGPPPKGGNVVGAELERLLVIDKKTGMPAIVIEDIEETKSVVITPLSKVDYNDILTTMGIDPATLPYDY